MSVPYVGPTRRDQSPGSRVLLQVLALTAMLDVNTTTAGLTTLPVRVAESGAIDSTRNGIRRDAAHAAMSIAAIESG